MRVRLLAVLFVCGSIACAGLAVNAQAPAAPPAPGTPAAPAPGTAPASAAPAPNPEKVKITILTIPSNSIKKVFVNWGKRKLGIIVPHHPLIVERPRDSGPLDLIITAEGYVPVQ